MASNLQVFDNFFSIRHVDVSKGVGVGCHGHRFVKAFAISAGPVLHADRNGAPAPAGRHRWCAERGGGRRPQRRHHESGAHAEREEGERRVGGGGQSLEALRRAPGTGG